MPSMIDVKNLTKTFTVQQRRAGLWGAARSLVNPQTRLVKAVDGINFSLQTGEMVGYLGPNGAGKSTTLKILTGLLVPTSGEVMVNGQIPWQNRRKYVAQIGAVFGQRTTLWWDLPVIDSLECLESIYSVPAERFRRNLSNFIEILEMGDFLHTPVRSLSLGQRMRADLCAALLHDPILLFLDEPTIGLDVVAKERIRQFIQYVNEDHHTTVVLTTHDLSDVERLCNRVIILDLGQILYDGSLAELASRFEGLRTLEAMLEEDPPQIILPECELVSREGSHVVFQFDPQKIPASELIANLLSHYRVADLEVRRPPLEVTIRRIYENRLLHTSVPSGKG